jgi:G3E family GTPase
MLDSVITVIDAVNGVGQFDTHFESVKQAAVADRIVISKTDLVGDGELDSLLARLAEINPSAEIHRAVMGGIEPAKLFGAGTADKDLSRWLVAGAREHEPGHHHNIQTFSVSHNTPIDPAGLQLWLDLLGSYRGPNLLRVKGLLNVAGRPVVVHAVQHLFHQPVALDDWPDEDRSSRIVFITHGIGREDITGTLKALDFKPVGPADGSSMDPQNYARFLSVVKGFENSSG